MADECREECGVVGIYLKNPSLTRTDTPAHLYSLLKAVQHRGQLSAGIGVYSPGDFGDLIRTHKEVGSVDELFRVQDSDSAKEFLRSYGGVAGIGHVRYATAGSKTSARDGAQPFERRHGRIRKNFALAFNGNLASYEVLKNKLIDEGYHLGTDVDTELLLHRLSLGLKTSEDIFEANKFVVSELDGSYSVVELFADGKLFFFRDALGFKPLVYGETEDIFAVASETVALEKVGIHDFKFAEPGVGFCYDGQKLEERVLTQSTRKSFCHLEDVYFSNPFSRNRKDQSVYTTRINLGEELAKAENLSLNFPENFVVVPVPNTAITAAQGYANALKLPFSLAIEKSDSKRGFINKAEDRKRIMGSVYCVHPEAISGKEVILIDDSVVRGETSKQIISQLRESGARKIHFRSTEPPIKFPCFYGIDFPTETELLSHQGDSEFLAKILGADSLKFMSIDGLVRAFNVPKNSLCLACLTGDYPTPCGTRNYI
jgi:amidophosphoribosyltransferase